MARPIRVTPERILAAAAREFAAHGYGGARVDRIAARARANKAMLYYHFRGKQDLYRALLRQLFDRVSATLRTIAGNGDPPEQQLSQAIGALAGFIETESYFPAVMLREIAEGGVHLDAKTLASMAAVPAAIGAIIARGVAIGRFEPVHPAAAYFSIVAPLVVFMAGAAIRRELAGRRDAPLPMPQPDEFVRHIQEVAVRMLKGPQPAGPRPAGPRPAARAS
jgi:AcrR family transcriptional regulator